MHKQDIRLFLQQKAPCLLTSACAIGLLRAPVGRPHRQPHCSVLSGEGYTCALERSLLPEPIKLAEHGRLALPGH